MLIALLFACDCGNAVTIHADLGGVACISSDDPAACCPNGYEWHGINGNDVVCYADRCEDSFAIASIADGLACDAESGCCPNGYEPAGFDSDGALICVGG